jgi:cellulose synthase/poly-beta-1,6-N-acetylglucosamine synthase-like glycosyltransferase
VNAIAYFLISLPVLLALYAYVVYPAILGLLATRGSRRELPSRPVPMPLITIVVPAYNEEHQIRGAIESLLAQDYPSDRRQLLVISDGSTDATNAIAREYSSQGVELLELPTRSGKTAAENAALSRIHGDIVINTDASVRLHPATVSQLVTAMADPRVGVASSHDVSVSALGGNPNHAEARYVGYEMRIRALETRTGGIVGASGSGYAIRMDLHRTPVPMDLSRDFSAALTAQRHGLRAVSVEHALCFVPRTASLKQEYRRKVRTIARGMGTLYFNRELLNPRRHGLFAWKLLSHKVCRWLVPLSAPMAVVGLLLLAPTQPWSGWVLGIALAGGALAVLGARWPDARPLPRFLPVAVLGTLSANLAVVHAALRFLQGHEDHTWEPTRRPHLPPVP